MTIQLLRAKLPAAALTYDVRGRSLIIVAGRSMPDAVIDTAVAAGIDVLRQALRGG